jgi:hypothetical protein
MKKINKLAIHISSNPGNKTLPFNNEDEEIA